MQNLSWRIFFQEQVKFLKSDIWFNFTMHQTKIHYFDPPGILLRNDDDDDVVDRWFIILLFYC